MLVEADKGLLLVVTPRNLDDLPLIDIYQRAQESKWVLAIVHNHLETRFRELYGSLPWDQIWYVDLSNGHDLEKALAEAQVKARDRKPKPVAPPLPPTNWTPEREWPKPRKRSIQAKWTTMTESRFSWYDEPVKGLRRKVRKMLKSSL